MSKSTKLEDIVAYLRYYYCIYNKTPTIEEWKVRDGFPCGKRRLLKICDDNNMKSNDLLEKAGYEVNRDNTIRYDYDDLKKKITDFILDYNAIYTYPPKIKEWKIKDGFPCNKETLVKVVNYNEHLKSLDLKTYKYGERRYNEDELLEKLRKAVLKFRSVDYRILRNDENVCAREVYNNIFGNFRNALRECGITNNEIHLLKKFPNYKLENARDFLIYELFNGKLTEDAEELISQGKEIFKKGVKPICSEVSKHISTYKTRKNFESFTYFIILCEVECSLSNKQQYRANDGHLCDSFEECVIDDALSSNGIDHEVQVGYPERKFRCDFKIGNCFVEYTGYKEKGGLKYINRLKEKKNCFKTTISFFIL